ncbi:MAG: gfo/Idh/MocA family oxidoreductase, partial [Gammaproteobacteria bacterium]|nr:gfo/Idh/MocA family oxidoreductase [Gammaproteobacteria bacterium]
PREETVEVAGLNPYRAELLDLVNALSTGKPTLLPDELSVGTMRLIDAVHESARTGQRVKIG